MGAIDSAVPCAMMLNLASTLTESVLRDIQDPELTVTMVKLIITILFLLSPESHKCLFFLPPILWCKDFLRRRRGHGFDHLLRRDVRVQPPRENVGQHGVRGAGGSVLPDGGGRPTGQDGPALPNRSRGNAGTRLSGVYCEQHKTSP